MLRRSAETQQNDLRPMYLWFALRETYSSASFMVSKMEMRERNEAEYCRQAEEEEAVKRAAAALVAISPPSIENEFGEGKMIP